MKKFDYASPYPHNTSGVRGVSFDKNRNLWEAKISHCGGRVRLGRFPTKEEAAAAYAEAAEKYRA